MFRIDGPTAAGGRFTGGDPAVPSPPTTVTPDWLNAVQEEIVAVILGAGLTLSKADPGQLNAAIRALITSGGVSFATDSEAVAGTIANKAVSPRAAAALVANRLQLLIGDAPPTLDTLGELAKAVSGDPNFGQNTTTALAARALAARRIIGAGLAVGGGDLTDDVTITVAAATGVEINAGTEATKALTPAAYAAAGGGDGSSGWAPLPGGNVLQWGSIVVIGGAQSSSDFTIGFPRPFLNVCGSVTGNANPMGAIGDARPNICEFAEPTIAGVTGRLSTTSSSHRVGTRTVRWQAIGR